jgi:predicted porin
MNKKIVALAVAAAFAVPVAASAQTTLFGQFKYEVGYIDGGADVDDNLNVVDSDSNLVHSTKGTRLGLRGSEDLGGGLKAIYRFQMGPGGANKTLASSSLNLNEESWVGLQGGFGTLQLGRSDTAMKKTGGNHFRAFTDTLAEPSLRPFQTNRADGIHYTTPNLLEGFKGYLTLEPNGVETDTYWALGADYQFGPFLVAAGFESSPDDGTYNRANMTGDTSNWQVGGKWNFGRGDIGVLWQELEFNAEDFGVDETVDVSVLIVPVNFKVTPNVNLRAAAAYVDPDVDGVDDWTNYGIGAQYLFSARTEAFVNVWSDGEIGNTDAGDNISNDSTHFGFGLRHSF